MKLKNLGRVTIGSILSVAAICGLLACSRDYTLAYLYITSTKGVSTTNRDGILDSYRVDYQTGSLTAVEDSPLTLTYANPVQVITTPDNKFIFVISKDDTLIQTFAIGTDGKHYAVTSNNSFSTVGSLPTWAAIDQAGKFMYVAFTYQPGYTTSIPGPGSIGVFPINTDGSLGTPVKNGSLSYFPVGNNPVSVITSQYPVTSGNTPYVYVLDQETTQTPAVLGFAENTTTGVIAPVTGTTITTSGSTTVATGYAAGTRPTAMIEDLASKYVYVTDSLSNQLYGFAVTQGTGTTAGNLTPLSTSPYPTGLYPTAITVDPRNLYLYVANYTGGTVTSYSIDSGGAPVSSGTTAVGTGPTCITIEQSLGKYLFVVNSIDSTVSALQLNGNSGVLTTVQNSPFPTSALPACAVALSSGSHINQYIVH